jgi:hypothetical protein
LRDTNNWRKKNNRAEISIGEEFYGADEDHAKN